MAIRTKLLLSFLLLTILLVMQFFVSHHFSVKEDQLVRQIIEEHNISHQLSGLVQAAQKIRRYEKEYFIYVQNPQKRDEYYRDFQITRQEIDATLVGLKIAHARSKHAGQQGRVAEWAAATEYYAEGFEQVHQKVLNGDIVNTFQANAAIKDAKNRFRVVLSGSHEAINEQLARARAEAEQIFDYGEQSSLIFTIVTDVSILIGLFISFRVPKTITRPMTELATIAEGISRGRINKPVKMSGSREIVELAESIERLRVAAQGLLTRLKAARKTAS